MRRNQQDHGCGDDQGLTQGYSRSQNPRNADHHRHHDGDVPPQPLPPEELDAVLEREAGPRLRRALRDHLLQVLLGDLAVLVVRETTAAQELVDAHAKEAAHGQEDVRGRQVRARLPARHRFVGHAELLAKLLLGQAPLLPELRYELPRLYQIHACHLDVSARGKT